MTSTDYESILVALRQITRAIDLYSKRLQKETGLTTSQLLVMQAIAKLDFPTPSSVALEIVLSQPTVTTLVDRLQKSGLVKREKLGTDRRKVGLVLTPEGEARVSEAPELLQAEFLRGYRELQSWEQHLLTSSLERVAAMMNAAEMDASPILTPGEIEAGGEV